MYSPSAPPRGGCLEMINCCLAALPRLPVIANQRARWCGNPPDEWNQVTITSKKREFPALVGTCRNIVRLTGGLPRQRARWLAMTAYLYKQQFTGLLVGMDGGIKTAAGLAAAGGIIGCGCGCRYDPGNSSSSPCTGSSSGIPVPGWIHPSVRRRCSDADRGPWAGRWRPRRRVRR